jgi:hypothetical protein
MKFHDQIDFNRLIGTHTILYGETNTKKTYFTAEFVRFLVDSKNFAPKQISILDFAPQLQKFGDLKIGGRIDDFYPEIIQCRNISFEGGIIPPRLTAKNKQELYKFAQLNYEKTHKSLEKFSQNPTKILIINDISIYLHLGDKKYLLDIIKKTHTFFGNSYYGSSIKGNFTFFFTLKEKRSVKYLIKKLNKSYRTG